MLPTIRYHASIREGFLAVLGNKRMLLADEVPFPSIQRRPKVFVKTDKDFFYGQIRVATLEVEAPR